MTESEIVFTPHAELRLRERKIREEEVKEVLTKPTWRFYDLKNGYQVVIGPRAKEGHYLIIVFDKVDDKIEVITVIDVSKSLEKIIKRRVENRRWVEL